MNDYIDNNVEKLLEITQRILRVRSVELEASPGAPFGEGVKEALHVALEISKALGFKAVNLDDVLGYAEFGEGNEIVSVLGHLDVVPEGKGWDYPPYGAEIHNGKMYARGAIDDKGPTMAALFGLYAIKKLKLPIRKRARIIFGTNEESGWKCMDYLKEKVKEPLIGFAPDGKFPIINREKGILNITIRKDFSNRNDDIIIAGGERPNMVPDYAEALLKNKLIPGFDSTDITIEGDKIIAKGISAHGALPEKGKNAISILMGALKNIELNPEVKEVIDFINKHVGFEVNGESLGIDFSDSFSGKLTVNLGLINMNENFASFTFNIRYPVSVKSEKVIEGIYKTLSPYSLKIAETRDQKPLFVDEDSTLVKALLSVYSEETQKPPYTLSIGGGTYARAMDVGVAFGPTFPDMEDVEHMANEYIGIDHLKQLSKLYGKAIYALAK